MSKTDTSAASTQTPSRRGFLKGAGLTVGGGAAAMAVGSVPAAAATPDPLITNVQPWHNISVPVWMRAPMVSRPNTSPCGAPLCGMADRLPGKLH